MVEPVVDYSKVDAVNIKKTIAFVNNFAINTTQFLNRFSYICEQRLNDVSRNLSRLEVTMALLEAKLNSISGLSGTQIVLIIAYHLDVSAPPPAAAAGAPAPAQAGVSPPPQAAPAAAPPPQEAEPAMKMKDDPRYVRYFKMVAIGIPLANVKQKMMLEGANPDVLDNPDAPSDYKGEGAVSVAARPADAGEGGGSDDDDDI